jgi:uncharacterized protein (TIGR00730 family)
MSKSIAVYCAASSRIEEHYLEMAYEFGKQLALAGYHIVYGGGNIGSMGKLADGAISVGGKITGVIPEFLMNLELGHNKLSQLHIVESMHSRQLKMLELSDIAIALPGGIGTLLELIEAITFKRLGMVTHPVIILNYRNYFAPLIQMLNDIINNNFMPEECRKLWVEADSITSAMDMLKVVKKYQIKSIL